MPDYVALQTETEEMGGPRRSVDTSESRSTLHALRRQAHRARDHVSNTWKVWKSQPNSSELVAIALGESHDTTCSALLLCLYCPLPANLSSSSFPGCSLPGPGSHRPGRAGSEVPAEGRAARLPGAGSTVNLGQAGGRQECGTWRERHVGASRHAHNRSSG